MKTCKECHLEKPLDQYTKHPKTADGYQPLCRPCASLLARQRARKNPEATAAYKRQYEAANKDRINAQRKVRRLENLEAAREKGRQHREANREHINELKRGYAAKYREANPNPEHVYKKPNSEKVKASKRAYYAEHREQIRAQQNARYSTPEAKANAAERALKWKRDNPDGRKRWWLMNFYNLTLEQYNEMLAKQNNSCAICQEEVKLHVDHDHDSGKVRGLLCASCNNGLGRFSDNILFLRAAIKYLKVAQMAQ